MSSLTAQLAAYYQRSPPGAGTADLFAVDDHHAPDWLGKLAAILLLLRRDNGDHLVDRVLVVSPPTASTPEPPELERALQSAFDQALVELIRPDIPPGARQAAFRAVQVVRPATSELPAAIAFVRMARRKTAVIIADAARYRAPGLATAADDDPAPEARWAPHLHALLTQAIAAATDVGCYVAVAAGEPLPVREDLRAMLLAVDPCGVFSSDAPSDLRDAVTAAQRWSTLAADGQLHRALDELQDRPDLSKVQKWLLRLRFLAEAGLVGEVRALLQQQGDRHTDLAPPATLALASIAESADADDFAAGLLAKCLPELGDREHLERALGVADRGGYTALAARAAEILAAAFPHAPALAFYRSDQHAAGDAPPADLAGANLVIIAAHGGVATPNRFFRSVHDDTTGVRSAAATARRLAGAGVVVLFVCSAGRADPHPEANTTLGLAKHLLRQGCRAVIAPPWPLETSVPPHWLPVFLASSARGAPVIDACFEANRAVAAKLGDNPIRNLAMSVYGDPLVVARLTGPRPVSRQST